MLYRIVYRGVGVKAFPVVALAALAVGGLAVPAVAKNSEPTFNATYMYNQYDQSFIPVFCTLPGTSYQENQDVSCTFSGALNGPEAISMTSAQTSDGSSFTSSLNLNFSNLTMQSQGTSAMVLGALATGQATNSNYRIPKDTSNDGATSYWGANAADVTVSLTGGSGGITYNPGSSLYGDYTLADNANYDGGYSDEYFVETGGGVVLMSLGNDGFGDNQGKDSPLGNFTGGYGGALSLTSDLQLQVVADFSTSSNTPLTFVGGLLGRPAIRALTAGGNGAANKTGDMDFAGNGGNGGSIYLTQSGAISLGFDANQGIDGNPFYGIWATSQGGVGSNRKNYAISSGGDGGEVNVTLTSALSTDADNAGYVGSAIGILAESVGGDSDFDTSHDYNDSSQAGDGGEVTATLGDGSGDGAGSIDFSVSGAGVGLVASSMGGQAPLQGASGKGGNTSVVINQGNAVTLSGVSGSEPFLIGAMAISAGSTASLDPDVDLDPDNEAMGTPGEASVSNAGTVTVQGGTGFGLAALSVGGAGTVSSPDSSSTDITLGVSSSNQISNTYSGSTASLTNSGTIKAVGSGATGMLAMSVGGNGGLVNYLGDADQAFVNMGGTSTDFTGGGNGGTVNVTNSGSVTTGSQSDSPSDVAVSMGVVAQSIGGGGGNSTAPAVFVGGNDKNGSGGGKGGPITVDLAANSAVTTYGTASVGVLAQSIGGGGGNGANTDGVFATVGGQGGNGGDGGTVTLSQDSGAKGLVTMGAMSYGIIAQSVGGGGGSGGSASVVNLSPFSAAVGGGGGSGGDGQTVSVSNAAPIATSGARAMGILGQSIGGGGGTGGAASDTSIELISISAAVGGSGGIVGNGGEVTVNNSSMILTGCDNAATGCAELQAVLADMSSAAESADSSSSSSSTSSSTSSSSSSSSSSDDSSSSDSSDQPASDESTDLAVSTVNPQGADAIGILIQSVGGGGGDGGTATDTSVVVPDGELPSVSIPISVGGSGGAGGDGDALTVTNSGSLVTPGDGAYGVVAQSIGGGGGNGGDSTATSSGVGSSETVNVTIDIAIGASGGSAGEGGTVSLVNAPDSDCTSNCNTIIATYGQYSTALLAQSIGGGGGTGSAGSASDNEMTVGEGASVAATVGVGGSGGSGGSGQQVSVTNGAGSIIVTTGTGARGILAQSIGGGGGMAGGASTAASGIDYSLSFAMGGDGGGYSNGGAVTIENDGVIRTGGAVSTSDGGSIPTGGDAAGILAQSIGGGGGAAGSSSVDTTMSSSNSSSDSSEESETASTSYQGNLSLGGTGGAGGDGGTLTITNTNLISTQGIRAHGVHAQTIGAGGGVAGAANSASDTPDDDSSSSEDDSESDTSTSVYNATVSLGGSGGGAGTGGPINLTSSGSVVTRGYGAYGFFAQSIGGGGGQGAEGTVDNSTTVSISAGVDGNDGSSGNGGAINVTESGTVITAGDDSYGLLAQSIGGGGGAANNGCSNSVSPDTSGSLLSGDLSLDGISGTLCIGNRSVDANYTDKSAFDITIGGDTGASGNGGAITYTKSSGSISTLGARSMGLVAQTLGGGGGLTAASVDNLSDVKVNDNPGNIDGTGGNISLTLGGDTFVQTFGAGSWGIFAQSVGGSGGFAGDSSIPVPSTVLSNSLNYASSSGKNPNAGNIDMTLYGAVVTTGSAGHGIVAQAVGGGGGFSSSSSSDDSSDDDSSSATASFGNAAQILNEESSVSFTGNGGAITINQESGGSISATGADAIGIFAQSTGNNLYQNPIRITLNGSVIGGTATAQTGNVAGGIFISGGYSWGGNGVDFDNANTVTLNAGSSLTSTSGVTGNAIIANNALTTVSNSGTLTGNVILQNQSDLGADDDMVNNQGTFNSGPMVASLGLTNGGTLAVLGDGMVGSTILQTGVSNLAANYTQTSTGQLNVDIDALAWSQKSDFLQVSGVASLAGQLNLDATASLLPGSYLVLLANEITGGLSVTDSLVYDWSTTINGGTEMMVSVSANFTPDGVDLTPSEQTIAGCLQSSWDAGGSNNLAVTFGSLSGITDGEDYAAALSKLDQATVCGG